MRNGKSHTELPRASDGGVGIVVGGILAALISGAIWWLIIINVRACCCG